MHDNDLPTRRAAASTIGARAGSGTTLTPAPRRFIRARRLWCRIVGHEIYSVVFRGGRSIDDCQRCDYHSESISAPAGVKEDEKQLWRALLDGVWPRDAGASLGIPPRRVAYLCEKWASKGIYNYGVSADLGWVELTADGQIPTLGGGHRG